MRETTAKAMRRGKNQTRVAFAMQTIAELRRENAAIRREDLQKEIAKMANELASVADILAREKTDHALTKSKLEDLRSELRAALEKKS